MQIGKTQSQVEPMIEYMDVHRSMIRCSVGETEFRICTCAVTLVQLYGQFGMVQCMCLIQVQQKSVLNEIEMRDIVDDEKIAAPPLLFSCLPCCLYFCLYFCLCFCSYSC